MDGDRVAVINDEQSGEMDVSGLHEVVMGGLVVEDLGVRSLWDLDDGEKKKRGETRACGGRSSRRGWASGVRCEQCVSVSVRVGV